MMSDYTFTKDPVHIDSLEQEIGDEAFAVDLLGSIVDGDQLTVSFDGSLTSGEEATLNAVVVNHSAPAPKPGVTSIVLKDGVDEPATLTDGVQLYVDVADGNLKVKFGDGHTVTLALDQ